VEVELTASGRVQTVDARIIEHVAAMAAFGAEAEIVDVRAAPFVKTPTNSCLLR
jgi:hypothetical protein